MNVDDRLGNKDVDAAALFAAARSFRPSARGRRRVLRALGLPIGLSLFGSGLAHAAYVVASSLKGWGMVAGVVATVGAAGGVTYVVTAPSTPTRVVSKQVSMPASRNAATVASARASVAGEAAAVEAEAVEEGAGVPAAVAAAVPAAVAAVVSRPVSRPVNRLSARAEPRALPSHRLALADAGGPSPPVVSKSSSEERPIEVAPVAAPSEPLAPLAPSSLAPPPFLASPESATPRPRPAADVARPAPPPAVSPASSSLKGELALVAEAQARLRVDDARGTFAALDLHVRLYPDGALVEEVELLRVRAFIAKGDARAARKTGETFLQRHSASPLRARFRSLMNALDVPAIP